MSNTGVLVTGRRISRSYPRLNNWYNKHFTSFRKHISSATHSRTRQRTDRSVGATKGPKKCYITGRDLRSGAFAAVTLLWPFTLVPLAASVIDATGADALPASVGELADSSVRTYVTLMWKDHQTLVRRTAEDCPVALYTDPKSAKGPEVLFLTPAEKSMEFFGTPIRL